MKKTIRKILKNDLVELAIVSLLALLVSLTYISTIGQKTTRARELYLEAYEANEIGERDKALDLLKKSNAIWESDDATKLIEELEASNH